MTAPAIELDRLEKRLGLGHIDKRLERLGSFTLGPLTLKVPTGAIYALIGPNGAGKTTTLDLLMGMGRPDSGSFRVLGMAFETHEVEIKRRTAYVSPELNYTAWGTVGRTVDFIRGFYPDWDTERCARLLGEFGLKREEGISALSFGARIKLSLVLALARQPELLLLDEPTVGLDAGARRQLFTELLAFMQRADRTILISSHQLADIERFADHCAILNNGKLMTSGRMDALVGRYHLLDVRLAREPHALDGVRLIERQGDRARMLLDRERASTAVLAAAGAEVINEVPLTLEDLFLALVR